MRSINRSAILELIRANSPISRTEISNRLDVSLPTVMRIIDGLTEENLVRPTGKTEYSGGRTRTMLEFNGSEHLVIGLDLGGTKLYGGVADLQGNILHEERFSHHQTQADESFQVLCDFIDRLLEFANGTGLPLMGIGLGVPGATDRETGNVKLAPSLGWFDFPLKNRLEARYDLPMLIENDVNLAALGELWARPIDVEKPGTDHNWDRNRCRYSDQSYSLSRFPSYGRRDWLFLTRPQLPWTKILGIWRI
jgi:glucokinase